MKNLQMDLLLKMVWVVGRSRFGGSASCYFNWMRMPQATKTIVLVGCCYKALHYIETLKNLQLDLLQKMVSAAGRSRFGGHHLRIVVADFAGHSERQRTRSEAADSVLTLDRFEQGCKPGT